MEGVFRGLSCISSLRAAIAAEEMPPCPAAVVAARQGKSDDAAPMGSRPPDVKVDPEPLPPPRRKKQKLSGLEGLSSVPPELEVKGASGRIYTGMSCCNFRPADAPRVWAIRFVEWKPFDPIILVTIICNCMTMAWESPLDPCCTQKAAFIEVGRARRAPPPSRARRARTHSVQAAPHP